jgi:hypothetical protein
MAKNQMAPCAACGELISKNAIHCLHCGDNTQARWWAKFILWGGCLGFVIWFLVMFLAFGGHSLF